MKASVGLGGGGPALSEPSFTDRSLAGASASVALAVPDLNGSGVNGGGGESSRKPSGAEAQAQDSAGARAPGIAEPGTFAARRLDLPGGSELSTIQEASTRAASGTSINHFEQYFCGALNSKYP